MQPAVLAALLAMQYGCMYWQQGSSAWLRQRQADYATFRTAHADASGLVDAFVRATAQAVAGEPPLAASVLESDSSLQLKRLSPSTPAPLLIWDDAQAPRMTVVPAGEFVMGAPASDAQRRIDEEPRHWVRIGYAFAVSAYPITVGEFALFAAQTRYPVDDRCESYEREEGKSPPPRSWRAPGFAQSPSHPVVCVSWQDAQAYVQWLSKKTAHHYRLLSEAEYEYAARAGSLTPWYWGAAIGHNHADCDGCGSLWDNRSTAPVGSFAPNAFGLYDMEGNVWSWLEDCSTDDYAHSPSDGSAAAGGDCTTRALRGGSWYFDPKNVRVTTRYWIARQYRFYDVGFRVARSL